MFKASKVINPSGQMLNLSGSAPDRSPGGDSCMYSVNLLSLQDLGSHRIKIGFEDYVI